MNIYEVRLKFKRNPMQIYFPGIFFLVLLVLINTTPLLKVISKTFLRNLHCSIFIKSTEKALHDLYIYKISTDPRLIMYRRPVP
jgi:hypothetical protein